MGANEIQAQAQILFAKYGYENTSLSFIAEESGVKKQTIYSSFYTRSLERIRNLQPEASIGILDMKVSDCLYKKRGCFSNGEMEYTEENEIVQTALHPFWKGMDLTKDKLKGQTVRAWFGEHLYPEKPTRTRVDLQKLECMGITDVILNDPGTYL